MAPTSGAVLLDCDGTLVDTERLLSEVTFLLLAPYIPGLGARPGSFGDWTDDFVQGALGRGFALQCEDLDAARAAAGLPGIGEVWPGDDGAQGYIAPLVAEARVALGLSAAPRAASLREAKAEENKVVLKNSRPCAGMREAVLALWEGGVPFCIASSSSRACLDAALAAAGLAEFFPDGFLHSGESDFDPPRLKPLPDIYLKAAAALGQGPAACVAVEDSESGVAAAANAGVGLIVGFVGGGHIAPGERKKLARGLLAGRRSASGRGADVVVSGGGGLPGLVAAWQSGSLTLPLKPPADGAPPPWGHGVEAWLRDV